MSFEVPSPTPDTNLDPIEIQDKTFTTSWKGYKVEEVRSYLAKIAQSIREINGEVEALRLKISEIDSKDKTVEQDHGEIISKAEEMARRIVHDANEAATALRTQAEQYFEATRVRADIEARELLEHTRIQSESNSLSNDGQVTQTHETMSRRELEIAREKASEIIEQSKAEGRAMIDQARDLRNEILSDLRHKRSVLDSEIADLANRRIEAYQSLSRAVQLISEAGTIVVSSDFEEAALQSQPKHIGRHGTSIPTDPIVYLQSAESNVLGKAKSPLAAAEDQMLKMSSPDVEIGSHLEEGILRVFHKENNSDDEIQTANLQVGTEMDKDSEKSNDPDAGLEKDKIDTQNSYVGNIADGVEDPESPKDFVVEADSSNGYSQTDEQMVPPLEPVDRLNHPPDDLGRPSEAFHEKDNPGLQGYIGSQGMSDSIQDLIGQDTSTSDSGSAESSLVRHSDDSGDQLVGSDQSDSEEAIFKFEGDPENEVSPSGELMGEQEMHHGRNDQQASVPELAGANVTKGKGVRSKRADEILARIRSLRLNESPSSLKDEANPIAKEPHSTIGVDTIWHDSQERADGYLGVKNPESTTSNKRITGDSSHEVGGNQDEEPRTVDAATRELLDAREEILAPTATMFFKKAKRILSDEQNEMLDKVRRSAGSKVILEEILDEKAQIDTIAIAALDFFEQVRLGVVDLFTDGKGLPTHKEISHQAVEYSEEFAKELVLPLRRKIEETLSQDSVIEDQSAVPAIGAIYREMRSNRLEELISQYVNTVFCATIHKESGYELFVWAIDPEDTPCADCLDNSLAGATISTEQFPTGHLHPAIHSGCRCLLVPFIA